MAKSSKKEKRKFLKKPCIFLIIFTILHISTCQEIQPKTYIDNSVQSVSKALIDVIRKVYISNDIKFDIFIFRQTSSHLNDVIDEVTKELSDEIVTKITLISTWMHGYEDNFDDKSAVIFVKSMIDLQRLQLEAKDVRKFRRDTLTLERKVSIKFKFLVYIEEVKTFKQLENLVKDTKMLKINYITDMRFSEFFVINEQNQISFAANLLYSEKQCGKFQPVLLNSFDKQSQKWIKKLENFDHLKNFHECLILFTTIYTPAFYSQYHKNLYEITDNAELERKFATTDLNFRGLNKELLDLMAERHNFTFHHSVPIKNIVAGTQNFKTNELYTLVFELVIIDRYNAKSYYSDPLCNFQFYYLLSPNDLYTNYEKLLFPFDDTTWAFMLFTFGIIFGVVIGVKFNKKLKTIIFGKGINSPGYNNLGIFFGISQLLVPKESFCRFILILNIWFCLIIRTCWQSMMFEFMTSDMRKPLPESIEDLIEMNYTIVMLEEYDHMKTFNDEIIKDRKRPNIEKNLTLQESYGLYQQALDGNTNRKYAFLTNTLLHLYFNSYYKQSLPIMRNEKLTKQLGVSFQMNDMLLYNLNEIIGRLTSAGIPQYLYDMGVQTWYPPYQEEFKDTRRILSMIDLEFGFVLFLAAAFLSIMVFICELHALYVKRKFKNLLGLYEFLRVLREKLKDYHDNW
ncbi:hypothetical protein PVAND_003186 [Polypedilum vanderplanki]|uniref:Ionotropic receptor n=1 Tax=Polypedilum vanderplanki TaxID=319348 RepID=A0A9J6BTS2_POLVA|nr:hypothetical protein PVAND_003186 [Polypedilum vanderplanki]